MTPHLIIIAAVIAATGFGAAWKIRRLERVKRVQRSFCSYIGFTRKCNGFVRSKSNNLLINANHSPPPRLPVLGYADNACGTIASSGSTVLPIFYFRGLSEIAYPVVCPVSVNMVNQSRRPFAEFVEPSESVRVVVNFINHYDCVPIGVYMPNVGAYRPSANSLCSGKDTAFSVVKKRRSDLVSRKGRIKSAHAVRPCNDGLGSDAHGLIHLGHCAF